MASPIKAQDLNALSRAYRNGQLVLCLGAGVSTPYRLPNWNDLVIELLLEASGRFTSYLVQYRRPLARYFAEKADLSLPALARIVEHAYRPKQPSDTFDEFIRSQLYREYRAPKEDTSLKAVARLVKRRWQLTPQGMPLVATFNFDNLLEEELKRQHVPSRPVFHGWDSPPADRVAVVHLNGFLPRTGKIPDNELVFTEEVFHHVASQTYHWSGAEFVRLLRRFTVLFVGLSMTDPNLRRFLDMSRENKKRYVLRSAYTEPNAADVTSLQTAARSEVERLGVEDHDVKTEKGALSALRHVLKRAKEWEEQLFKEMGIRPLWIESHDDIPNVLDRIGAPPRRRR